MESCKVLIRACAAYDKATFLESTASSPTYISLLKQNFEPYITLQRCALDETISSKITYRLGSSTHKDHSRGSLFEDNLARPAGAIDRVNIITNVASHPDVATLHHSRTLPVLESTPSMERKAVEEKSGARGRRELLSIIVIITNHPRRY